MSAAAIHSEPARPSGKDGLEYVILALIAALPLLSLVHAPWAYLADPRSELPVKLWAFETFFRNGVFGGQVCEAGWPNAGPLNNPDPVGTLVTAVLRPLLGRAGAWNGLIYLQLLANMLAMRALLRTVVGSRGAGVFGAVAFGLTPLVLVYCVSGAVSDMLNLWPWLLALKFGLCAWGGATGSPPNPGDDPSERFAWHAVMAGVFSGVGFVACPYNALIFSVVAVPLLPFVVILSPPTHPGAGGRAAAVVLAAAASAALIAGPYAWQMKGILDAAGSQVSAESVADTRHAPPFPFLEPAHPDRYTAFLTDYVAVGKDKLIEREAGSRYFRAFSPGLSLFALAIVGLGTQRRRAPVLAWWAVAGFCALASLGPFSPVDLVRTLGRNQVWLWLHAWWPGTNLLLEPFRYALPAVAGLVVAAAFGIDGLERWTGARRVIGPVAVIVWLAELVWLSPVPMPLRVATLTPSPAISQLDGLIPAGAVIELPYFAKASERFERTHFFDQLVHHRAIPDEVIGFPARYLRENNYTAALLAAEKPYGRLRVQVVDPTRIEVDRLALPRDGFAAILVDRAGFATPSSLQSVTALLAAWGQPVQVGGTEVYLLQ